jgi:hypothetical protein
MGYRSTAILNIHQRLPNHYIFSLCYIELLHSTSRLAIVVAAPLLLPPPYPLNCRLAAQIVIKTALCIPLDSLDDC